MKSSAYPEDLRIGIAEFRNSGWFEILNQLDRPGYVEMHAALSAVAGKAISDGNLGVGKALWLLADCSSMMLRPSSRNEPFHPCSVFGDARSAVPGDFSPDDLEFIIEILPEINEPWLRARVADLVWTIDRKRGVDFPNTAIDAYTQIPLSKKCWFSGADDCWERALSLALLINARDKVGGIEEAVLQEFRNAESAQDEFCLHLSSFMLKAKLGKQHLMEIADGLDIPPMRSHHSGAWEASAGRLVEVVFSV